MSERERERGRERERERGREREREGERTLLPDPYFIVVMPLGIRALVNERAMGGSMAKWDI